MTFPRRSFMGALSAAVIAVAIEVLPGARKPGVERPWTPSTPTVEYEVFPFLALEIPMNVSDAERKRIIMSHVPMREVEWDRSGFRWRPRSRAYPGPRQSV